MEEHLEKGDLSTEMVAGPCCDFCLLCDIFVPSHKNLSLGNVDISKHLLTEEEKLSGFGVNDGKRLCEAEDKQDQREAEDQS